MDLGIKGKRVLITGASQGIGKAIAVAFAKEGCRVVVIARGEDKLKELVAEMGGITKGHAYYACDLMQKGITTEVVNKLVSEGGEFEIVVHNIGGTLGLKNPLLSAEDWYKVWYFNAGIAIDINALIIPPMQRQKWGRIIHISSISAESIRGSTPYAAVKAYVNAYVKGVGRSFAKDNIVISALMPGAVYSEGGDWDENSERNRIDKEAFLRKKSDFLRHHHAIGRLGEANEIAPFAVFMASKYVSFAAASIIPIDGGTM